MARLRFKNDKKDTLARMMKFSNSHKRKYPYEKETTEDLGLWLVKDDGIYLMSPTKESFCLYGDKINSVVYAEGYKPTKDNQDTLWDKTYAVSSDDFAEFIPLNKNATDRIIQGNPIVIDLGETEFSVLV
jgi:hypothetical protein|tara:strand:+ start:1503 stop:1892 length:390 start_codon:yes stop_codon:yes gene_type:complete